MMSTTSLTDAESGNQMAAISNAERLARAVLMFWQTGPWSAFDRERWLALTGEVECTSKTLCDLARHVRSEEEAKQ